MVCSGVLFHKEVPCDPPIMVVMYLDHGNFCPDLFQILEMCQIELKCQFVIELFSHKKNLMYPSDASPLSSMTLNPYHSLHGMLRPPPVQCRKLLDRPCHGSTISKKKIVFMENMFFTPMLVNSKYMAKSSCNFLDICKMVNGHILKNRHRLKS